MKRLSILITVMLIAIAFSISAQAVEIQSATGKLTFLRVHDVGGGFGHSSDFLDVEVVIMLNSEANRAFGFQLRNDDQRPAREGMLSLLVAAFNRNWTVEIDYFIEPGKKNGLIFRVALIK